jgi:diguanylate cyclase (GGDEF)-like protein/PAS domain S-box-containing protein
MEAAIRDPGRVAPLERSRLLDGAAAASLDPVARISRRLLGSSAAIACLIAPDRQVVIGRDGFAGSVRSLRRRPLTRALSELVVRSGGPLLVADARRDTPALARREPDVIGYAGVPLHDGDGHILGALCATSSEPRAWSAVDLELLSDVASLAISEISRVTVAAAAERCLRAQDQAEAIASVGSWQWDRDGNRLVCSTELRRLLALARNPATLTELEALMPADRRADLLAAVRAALRPDGGWQAEHRLAMPDGRWRVLISRGFVSAGSDGAPERVRGTLQDVTESFELEQRLRASVSGAPVGVARLGLVGGERGRWLDSNSELERMLGAAAGELDRRQLEDSTHPDDLDRVLRVLDRLARGDSLRTQHEQRLQSLDGGWLWVLARHTVVAAPAGEPAYAIGHYVDVSERHLYKRDLEYLADHDALTGVFNRHRFEQELDRTLSRASRAGSPGALLVFDLDALEHAAAGHAVGDGVIVRIVHSLAAMLRAGDTFGRLGDDEFAILLPDADAGQARRVAERLLRTVRRRLDGGRDGEPAVGLTASVGIAIWGEQRALARAHILGEADTALYDAKRAGGDRYAVYTDDDDDPGLTPLDY